MYYAKMYETKDDALENRKGKAILILQKQETLVAVHSRMRVRCQEEASYGYKIFKREKGKEEQPITGLIRP